MRERERLSVRRIENEKETKRKESEETKKGKERERKRELKKMENEREREKGKKRKRMRSNQIYIFIAIDRCFDESLQSLNKTKDFLIIKNFKPTVVKNKSLEIRNTNTFLFKMFFSPGYFRFLAFLRLTNSKFVRRATLICSTYQGFGQDKLAFGG